MKFPPSITIQVLSSWLCLTPELIDKVSGLQKIITEPGQVDPSREIQDNIVFGSHTEVGVVAGDFGKNGNPVGGHAEGGDGFDGVVGGVKNQNNRHIGVDLQHGSGSDLINNALTGNHKFASVMLETAAVVGDAGGLKGTKNNGGFGSMNGLSEGGREGGREGGSMAKRRIFFRGASLFLSQR